jgi:hypothetical protein
MDRKLENHLNDRIATNANQVLRDMREYRDYLMGLPDDETGRSHSHGETDNSRGLRLRAISLAITKLEDSLKRFEDVKNPILGEFYLNHV